MTTTVKNISKQPVVLVLDHPAFATKANGWNRTAMHFGSSTGDGRRVVTEVRRSHPGSITIMPGETVTDLHAAVANCSQVAGLVAQRILEVTDQDTQPSADTRTRVLSQPKQPTSKSAAEE